MKAPKISVIVPVYNGERYLARTLISILDQSCRDFEVVAVDDGSTDRSGTILKGWAAVDGRVKVHSKPNGGNAGKAVRYGLERASGEWMMYCSQDDLLSPDLLEKNLEAVLRNGAQAAVPNMAFWFSEEDIRPARRELDRVVNGREAFLLSLDWRVTGFTMWSMELVRRVGWGSEWINADEFTTRMLYAACDRVAPSDGTFYYFQGNEESITRRWRPDLLESFITNDRIEKYMEEMGFSREEIVVNHTGYVNEMTRILSIFLRSEAAADRRSRKKYLALIREKYELYRDRMLSAPGLSLAKRICFSDWHLLLLSRKIENRLRKKR
jgi:glycosyltransferase involved in cell wall biosynthesis